MATNSIPSSQNNFCSSRLDQTIIISQNDWAVTLIRATNSNHAELVIEGVDEINRQFLKVAHLVGRYSSGRSQNYGFKEQAEVKISKVNSEKLKFDGKTQTWVRARDLVLRMTAQIENEKNHPKEYPVVFDILGKDSVFVKSKYQINGDVKTVPWVFRADWVEKSLGKVFPTVRALSIGREVILLKEWEGKFVDFVDTHSCITWAKDKLRMINVNLPDADTGWFATRTKEYTN